MNLSLTMNSPSVRDLMLKIKATEQYFHVVLLIILYKVVLTLYSVNETLQHDHPNQR